MASATDQRQTYSGFLTLQGGVDAGKTPALLPAVRVADGQNVSFRGGELQPRPAVRKINLSFVESGSTPTTISDWFKVQLFQGSGTFLTDAYEGVLVSIGGHLHSVVIDDNTPTARVQRITPPDGRNARLQPRTWFCQADKYCVVNNDQSVPIIFDGVTARRAKTSECVIGSCMSYGSGRLFINRGNLIFAGDLIGSTPTAPLSFLETQFLSEGQPFGVRSAVGRINYLGFLDVQDAATGTGALLIGGDNGITSALVDGPRSGWKDGVFERCVLIGVGIKGSDAAVSINGDLWSRASDGWRSYRQARADIGGWARIPMSQEINNYLLAETESLLQYTSAINFDRRLIFTVAPQNINGRVRFCGVAALDFDILGSFGQADRPAWEGIWTGIQPTKLFTGVFAGRTRAFAFCWTPEDGNCLYEILRDPETDVTLMPTSRIITREMDFGVEYDLKQATISDIWLGQVKSDWSMTLNFKKDRSSEIFCWGTRTGTMAQCVTPSANGSMSISVPGAAPRKVFPEPEPQADSTGRDARRFFGLQMILTFTGNITILRARFRVQQLEEAAAGEYSDPPIPVAGASCPFPGDSLGTTSTCTASECETALDERIAVGFENVPITYPGTDIIIPFIPPPS